MAGRVMNRRALRDENDQAELAERQESADDSAEPAEVPKRRRKPSAAKSPKVKAPAKPRVRKKSVKALPRMFARWAVCDNGLKRVAVFEYKDRAGADDKLAELLGRKPGAYLLQLVKVPHEPPAAAE